MNAKIVSLAILVPIGSQAHVIKTIPATTTPLTMSLAPMTTPVSSPVTNLITPALPSLPALAIPAVPITAAAITAKTGSEQSQDNPMTVLTAAASEESAATETGRTFDGGADQEDDHTPVFVRQAQDSLKNQARADLKIQLSVMKSLSVEFKKHPEPHWWNTDYRELFREKAEEAARTLRKIGTRESSSEASQYTKALLEANVSVNQSNVSLLPVQDIVRWADFNALSQAEIEQLLEKYKSEGPQETPDYPPFRMKDLDMIQRKLKNGAMNEYGLRASLAFIQQNNGERIFFPLMDRIKNEWQLMAFHSLLAHLHSQSVYADSYTQKSHARSIIYASTPKRLAMFRNVLEENRYILRKGPLLKQVSRHIQNNPPAEDALKQLTAMSELLSNLDINLDDPRLIKLLSRIDNIHQVDALKQIAQRKSTILPNERHTTTTYHKKELTFGEEIQDFLVGVDKRGTWDFETEYQPSPILQRALTKLILEVGDIRNEQDAKNHAARLAEYLKVIEG
jgi:hypothetical protein